MPASTEKPKPSEPGVHSEPPAGVAQEIRWEDFRDHLATAHQDGRRRWLYPRKVDGRWFHLRTLFSWVLLGIMAVGPFIKIEGNPLLMINIVERKFSILGQIFWPQDTIIFAVAMLIFLTGIIIFTTAFGRLWCGWACPQTVLMEMVFRKIEYALEGDAAAQRALDAAPWTARKIARKAFKQFVFFALSFLIANWLLSYIIGIEELRKIVLDDPRQHLTGLGFMLGFTLIFYLIFARFREQACTFICPYGRFQSAMLDENTLVVAYDYKRGEKRAPLARGQNLDSRRAQGHGDCVNCHHCVAVCPTGIDIRNGTQMECVHCTACIDACDSIMEKVGRPPGLIRYASLNSIERGVPARFTARMGWYTAVLGALTLLFAFLLMTRSEIETIVLRAPGALFQQAADGKISNLYTVKIANKSNRDITVDLKLEGLAGGTLTLMNQGALFVRQQGLAQTSALIVLPPEALKESQAKLKIGVYSGGRRIDSVRTRFAGPRN